MNTLRSYGFLSRQRRRFTYVPLSGPELLNAAWDRKRFLGSTSSCPSDPFHMTASVKVVSRSGYRVQSQALLTLACWKRQRRVFDEFNQSLQY